MKKLGAKVWAITCYFPFDDPDGDRRRLRAYREFRRRLVVPLVTVELARDGDFDLDESDAEKLIQVAGGAMLWQKERLLNLALEALPPECDTVLWADCDMVLARQDWPEAAREALREHRLVHAFDSLRFLTETEPVEDLSRAPVSETRRSAVLLWREGRLPRESFRSRGYSNRLGYSPGLAWAARRDWVERHGFYDAIILGAGDKALFSAACGRQREFVDAYCGGTTHARHYLDWADEFEGAVRGRLGVIQGDAYHLFHGELENRGYDSRYEGFDQFGFDPDADLRFGEEGAWEWGSEKPAMHEFVRLTFERRKRVAG